jgi:hypothetical protein
VYLPLPQLGVIPKGLQSEATCSHAYVKGGTHTWTEADGVMIFNRAVLPGYSALFRHYNDDMYLGTATCLFTCLFVLLMRHGVRALPPDWWCR